MDEVKSKFTADADAHVNIVLYRERPPTGRLVRGSRPQYRMRMMECQLDEINPPAAQLESSYTLSRRLSSCFNGKAVR